MEMKSSAQRATGRKYVPPERDFIVPLKYVFVAFGLYYAVMLGVILCQWATKTGC